MNTETNNINLEFGKATSFSEPILVKMQMPDGSKPVIGSIIQDWNDSDVPVIYSCLNELGEQIAPSTEDWVTAEATFDRYAKKYEEKQREIRQAELVSRANQMDRIRQYKGREAMEINK